MTIKELKSHLNIENMSKKSLLKTYFSMKNVRNKYGQQLIDAHNNVIDISKDDYDFALLMLKANRLELDIYGSEILRRQTLVN